MLIVKRYQCTVSIPPHLSGDHVRQIGAVSITPGSAYLLLASARSRLKMLTLDDPLFNICEIVAQLSTAQCLSRLWRSSEILRFGDVSVPILMTDEFIELLGRDLNHQAVARSRIDTWIKLTIHCCLRL